MSTLRQYRLLIAGILAPFLAVGSVVCISYWREHWNHLFALHVTVFPLAILVTTAFPFLITVVLATRDRRRQMLSLSEKIGVGIGAISLVLPSWAAYQTFFLWRSSRNLSLHDVPAPVFRTLDLDGKDQSLTAQKGRVVLVNIWGTWCAACRAEMPELDGLYREHREEGLVVFGLSDEDVATQKKCLEKIPVTYPLLTYKGEIPALYRQVALYPTTFLIDRNGKLQGGSNVQDFSQLQTSALALLHSAVKSDTIKAVGQ